MNSYHCTSVALSIYSSSRSMFLLLPLLMRPKRNASLHPFNTFMLTIVTSRTNLLGPLRMLSIAYIVSCTLLAMRIRSLIKFLSIALLVIWSLLLLMAKSSVGSTLMRAPMLRPTLLSSKLRHQTVWQLASQCQKYRTRLLRLKLLLRTSLLFQWRPLQSYHHLILTSKLLLTTNRMILSPNGCVRLTMTLRVGQLKA